MIDEDRKDDDLRAYSCALMSAATLRFSDQVQRRQLLWLSLKGPRLAEGHGLAMPMRQICIGKHPLCGMWWQWAANELELASLLDTT